MQAGEHWLAIIILTTPGLLLVWPAISQLRRLISLELMRKLAAVQIDIFGTETGTEIFWPFYYPAGAQQQTDRGAVRLSKSALASRLRFED